MLRLLRPRAARLLSLTPQSQSRGFRSLNNKKKKPEDENVDEFDLYKDQATPSKKVDSIDVSDRRPAGDSPWGNNDTHKESNEGQFFQNPEANHPLKKRINLKLEKYNKPMETRAELNSRRDSFFQPLYVDPNMPNNQKMMRVLSKAQILWPLLPLMALGRSGGSPEAAMNRLQSAWEAFRANQASHSKMSFTEQLTETSFNAQLELVQTYPEIFVSQMALATAAVFLTHRRLHFGTPRADHGTIGRIKFSKKFNEGFIEQNIDKIESGAIRREDFKDLNISFVRNAGAFMMSMTDNKKMSTIDKIKYTLLAKHGFDRCDLRCDLEDVTLGKVNDKMGWVEIKVHNVTSYDNEWGTVKLSQPRTMTLWMTVSPGIEIHDSKIFTAAFGPEVMMMMSQK